jgi:hypothetical protein
MKRRTAKVALAAAYSLISGFGASFFNNKNGARTF